MDGALADHGFPDARRHYAGVLDLMEEMELAAHLLEISSPEELDRFLGHVIKRTVAKLGRSANKPSVDALVGLLRNVVQRTFPLIGRQVAPAITGVPARRISPDAERFYGVEVEGLSPEDQEFTVAVQFVRFASRAAREAVQVYSRLSPGNAARSALMAAARRFAPGLLDPAFASNHDGPSRGGWMRRGRDIVLFNVY